MGTKDVPNSVSVVFTRPFQKIFDHDEKRCDFFLEDVKKRDDKWQLYEDSKSNVIYFPIFSRNR